jgi:hypothetical protein
MDTTPVTSDNKKKLLYLSLLIAPLGITIGLGIGDPSCLNDVVDGNDTTETSVSSDTSTSTVVTSTEGPTSGTSVTDSLTSSADVTSTDVPTPDEI